MAGDGGGRGMVIFVVWVALHYQIVTQPVFRPSLALIRGHEVVPVVEIPKNGELQPDGVLISMRIRY